MTEIYVTIGSECEAVYGDGFYEDLSDGDSAELLDIAEGASGEVNFEIGGEEVSCHFYTDRYGRQLGHVELTDRQKRRVREIVSKYSGAGGTS